jgi:hypothetical protein
MTHAGRCCAFAALLTACAAGAAEDYSFDAADFEKKPFELGGYVQLRREDSRLRTDSALYRLNNYGLPQRDDLGRTTGILELAGRIRHGDATFDFRTHSQVQRDEIAQDTDNVLYEGAYTLRASPALSLEAGKRVMRWGKGYAFNPVGFVERPKDPNDPELAREGYWLASADYIRNFDGALQTLAFTPVVVPVGRDVNSDFGATQYLNPAAKLYMLYRDTDIDLLWQGKGSRPARYGFDFSRNVASNFEVHGEWARTQQAPRRVADSAGRVTATTENATSYLLGLRYLTEGNTTYIAEYYRNGTGYSADQSQDFYRFVDDAFSRLAATGDASLVQRAIALSQGSYGRPNPGAQYVYFRAQQKDAFGIVYFQPGVTAMINLEDRSYQVTPELLYTGVNNVELRARIYLLQGDRHTDFGAKQNARKIELQARLYF